MSKANARIIAEAAILTEGERERWTNILSWGHLPLLRNRQFDFISINCGCAAIY